MAIVAINSVVTDKTEYSQYETSRNTITVTIKGNPPQPALNDTLVVEIRKARRNRDVVVAQISYAFDGIVANFDTVGIQVKFILPNILGSPKLIRMMRQGQYFIHVYDEANPTTIVKDSSDFAVRVITIQRMKDEFLFGLYMQSTEMRGWKMTPKRITGITLKETSRRHPMAFYPLCFELNNGQAYLSWASGEVIPVSTTVPDSYILPTPVGADYIVVEVDPTSLPATSQKELLLMEQKSLGDEAIDNALKGAYDQLENIDLQVFLEPTRCVTDIDPSQITFSTQNVSPILIDMDYDKIVTPVTYFKPRYAGWINIDIPFRSLLTIDQLFGAVGNTRVCDINLEWVQISEADGFTQLVPFNQEVAFDYIGLIFVRGMSGNLELPNFWHYSALAGLRDVPYELQQYIGRLAAMPLLLEAQQAMKTGLAGQSISRDSISESLSFTNSATYGMLSSSIEEHRRWIQENGPRIRSKYRGPCLVVM